jgi:hypothetical protein
MGGTAEGDVEALECKALELERAGLDLDATRRLGEACAAQTGGHQQQRGGPCRHVLTVCNTRKAAWN